jgi:hypothetical protein
MNRVTVASAAFLVLALLIAGWVLSRPATTPTVDGGDAVAGAATGAGLTFAEWSVRNDAVLLADIDPGAGTSTVPRRFTVFTLQAAAGEPVTLKEAAAFSWAPADRIASAAALSERGFTVSAEGIVFPPPEDPLFSDPIARSADAGAEQRVTLRGKSGFTATLVRRRGDPQSAPSWNRRAIGFASSDGRLVYVTPDAVIARAGR